MGTTSGATPTAWSTWPCTWPASTAKCPRRNSFSGRWRRVPICRSAEWLSIARPGPFWARFFRSLLQPPRVGGARRFALDTAAFTGDGFTDSRRKKKYNSPMRKKKKKKKPPPEKKKKKKKKKKK